MLYTTDTIEKKMQIGQMLSRAELQGGSQGYSGAGERYCTQDTWFF